MCSSFPEGSKFICPVMGRIGRRILKYELGRSGWEVIEDVRPGAEGVSAFRESLKEAVRGLCH